MAIKFPLCITLPYTINIRTVTKQGKSRHFKPLGQKVKKGKLGRIQDENEYQ